MTQRRFLPTLFLSQLPDSGDKLKALADAVSRRILELLGGIVPGEPPAVPAGLQAIPGQNQITLNWLAAAGALRYEVFRASELAGPYSLIGQTQGTTFVYAGLQPETIHFFQVRSVSSGGLVSGFSQPVGSSTSPGTLAPAAPPTPSSPAVGSPTANSLTISWAALSGTAVNTSIYRSTVNGGPYIRVAQGVSGTSYVDSGLVSGTQYYYRLTHLNVVGAESAQSSQVSGTPIFVDTTAPPVPTGLATTAGDAQVLLSWVPVVANDLVGYQVYRGTVSGGPYTLIETTSRNVSLQSGLTNGTPYYFVVRSLDTSNNASANSAQATATPAAVVTSVPPPQVTGVAAVAVDPVPLSAKHAIQVSWTALAANDIASYQVYTSTSVGGPFALVASVAPSVTATNILLGAETGLVYFYVVAVNTSSLVGPPSATVSSSAIFTPSNPPVLGGSNEIPATGTVTGTQLGTTHRTRSTDVFDYVVDVREYSGPLDGIRIGIQRFREMIQANEITFRPTGTRTQIAVLVPGKTETVRLQIGNAPGAGQSAIMPAGRYDIHFIGPYPASLATDVDDVLLDIADETIGYSAFPWKVNISEYGGVGVGGSCLTLRHSPGHDGDPHFWWIAFKHNQRVCIDGYPADPLNRTDNYYIHGMRVDQDGLEFPIRTRVNSQGQTVQYRDHSQWTISTYWWRGHVEGVYSDCPWNEEHFLYQRNQGYGTSFWKKLRILRSGGQAMQFTNRSTDGPRIDQPLGADPGTILLEDIYAVDYGRCDRRAASALSFYGVHQPVTMNRCRFFDFEANTFLTGPPNVWPPYFNGTFSGPAEPDTVGGIQFTNTNSTDYRTIDGHMGHGLTMRDCQVYSLIADKSIFTIWTGKLFDIEDCDFLCGPTGQNSVWVGERVGDATSTYRIDSFRWTGNNDATRIAAFNTEFSLTGTRTPRMIMGNPGQTSDVGDLSGTYIFSNWLGGPSPI